ncbi:MAG: hypothetical protein KC766_02025 [Myxococcales bacterium]|nr:hypothetical protein [Myxococcales bacterium]
MLPSRNPLSEAARRSRALRRHVGGVWLTLSLLATASGCRCNEDAPPSPRPAIAAAPAVQRGDQVLVEPSAGVFFEARVLALENNAGTPALKLQRSDGELLSVDAADVYRLPGSETTSPPSEADPLPAGRLAVCELRGHQWVGCRVKSRLDAGYRVEDYGGEERSITAGKIIVPSELTRMNLDQRFRLADARRGFDKAAAAAGQPAAPKGFNPGYKERVVARRGDEWFSAHIVRFHDDGAFRVRWMSDNRENDVQKSDVIPEPPYPKPPKRGGFVLLKPHVQSLPWARWRVVSVRPQLVLEDGNGVQTTSDRRQVVPLSQ